jgi:hypothetical protein
LGVSLLFEGSGFSLAAKTCLHPPPFYTQEFTSPAYGTLAIGGDFW